MFSHCTATTYTLYEFTPAPIRRPRCIPSPLRHLGPSVCAHGVVTIYQILARMPTPTILTVIHITYMIGVAAPDTVTGIRAAGPVLEGPAAITPRAGGVIAGDGVDLIEQH